MPIYQFSGLYLVLIIVASLVSSSYIFDFSFTIVYGQNNETESVARDLNDDNEDSEDQDNLDTNEQGIPCNTIGFEGPSYTGPNGCPLPCPQDPNDEIPKECPQPESNSNPPSGDKEMDQVPTLDNDEDDVTKNNDIGSDGAIVGCNTLATTDPNYEYCITQKPIQTLNSQPGQGKQNFNTATPDSKLSDKRFDTERKMPTSDSVDPAKPYTPGLGEAQRDGSILDPKLDLQIPENSSQIPVERDGIKGEAYLTVIVKFVGVPENLRYVNISMGTSVYANPPYAYVTGSESSVTFTLLAPGHTGYILGYDGTLKMINRGACFFYINADESRTCTFTFIPESLEEQVKNRR